MTNGRYSVEFSGLLPGIGGIATLENGVISGSDAAYKWSGNYSIEERSLTGSIQATPERSALNVFGDDHAINLTIVGTIRDDNSIEVLGTRENLPEQRLVAILRPIELP